MTEAEADRIDAYHCPRCSTLHGPSTRVLLCFRSSVFDDLLHVERLKLTLRTATAPVDYTRFFDVPGHSDEARHYGMTFGGLIASQRVADDSRLQALDANSAHQVHSAIMFVCPSLFSFFCFFSDQSCALRLPGTELTAAYFRAGHFVQPSEWRCYAHGPYIMVLVVIVEDSSSLGMALPRQPFSYADVERAIGYVNRYYTAMASTKAMQLEFLRECD